MNKKYICSAAILMAATAAFTGCSSAPEKPAAAKTEAAAPAAKQNTAAQQLTDKEVRAALNGITKQHQIRSNRWDNAKIDAAYRAYFAENQKKMNPAAIACYGEMLAMNGKRLENPASVNEGVAIVKKSAANPYKVIGSIISSSLERNHALELKYSEELFAKEKGNLDPNTRIWLYNKFMEQILFFTTDIKRVEGYVAELKDLKFDSITEKKRVEGLERTRWNAFKRIIATAISHDLNIGTALYEKYKGLFNEQEQLDFCVTFCRAAVDMKDRALFDKKVAPIKASADSNIKFERLRSVAGKAGGSVGAAIYQEILNNRNLTPAQRFYTLSAMINYPRAYVYFFHERGSYEKAKGLFQETLKLADAYPKDISRSTVERNMDKGIRGAFGFGDYKFFDELVDQFAAHTKNPIAYWDLRVPNLLRQGKTADAIALLDLVLENKRINAQTRKNARLWKYFVAGGTFEGFDAAFADLKFNSEQKMEEIRKVGAMFFRGKQFEKARALNDAVVKNMFRPAAINKRYTVKYLKNAPKTAEAWTYTDGYKNWDGMETRFTQYYGYDVHHDAKLLKDAVLTPLKDEYRAGLHIVYDDLGVHIYGRFNDPDVEEVNLGKRKGASLEWMFRPGQKHAYHSFYFDALPNTEDPHYVNWAAPTKNYRLTYDTVFKDAVTTPEGYASHAFIPWIAVYDKLPSKDNQWILGLQVKNGDFRTLSGLVHEMGRGLKLDFEFTPAQRAALEKTICIQAFNRYNTIRKNAGGIIQNWNDYLLGDPEFYEAVLKDYIAELDEAGKKLQEAKTDAEIHALFVKYAPQWAEINYILEEKRAAYLKDALFK